MKKIKHSKFKNTGVLFELLVRQITLEVLNGDKTENAKKIVREFFAPETELNKELRLYDLLLKEKYNSENRAEKFVDTVSTAHSKLNEGKLTKEKYNLIKEIRSSFDIEQFLSSPISNYKVLASVYMLFEYDETDNVKQLLECKNVILQNNLITSRVKVIKDPLMEQYEAQPKDIRLLTYKLLVDKFNDKYAGLDNSQKQLLNKYIVNVNDTEALKEYIQTVIPTIKIQLSEHVKHITDKVTKIKVEKLSEMLCTVENMKTIKESHVLSLLRYFDLIRELRGLHE